MKKGGVNAAFGLVLEEMEAVIDERKVAIERKSKAGQYDEVKEEADVCKKLEEFRDEISNLHNRWITTRPGFRNVPQPVSRRTAQRGKLVVIFPEADKRLACTTSAETFSEAIRFMGVRQAMEIGLQGNGGPLISPRRRADRYGDGQHEVDGCYVLTSSSTVSKKMQLEEIARALEIKINVAVVL